MTSLDSAAVPGNMSSTYRTARTAAALVSTRGMPIASSGVLTTTLSAPTRRLSAAETAMSCQARDGSVGKAPIHWW